MLTRQDFRFNFLLMRAFSVLRIFPVDINAEHGILQVPNSPWKRRTCFAIFGVICLHCSFVLFRLLQVLLFTGEIVRHHLVFLVEVLIWCIAIPCWYIACFIHNAHTFCTLFSDGFAGINGQSKRDQRQFQCFFRLTEFCTSAANGEFLVSSNKRSRQEWLALTMLPQILLLMILVLLLYAYDQSVASLLYMSLPEDYKTVSWFALLFCEEVLFLTFMAYNGTIVVNAQLLFMENIIGRLKILHRSLAL